MDKISTSYADRSNLTLRMSMLRITRIIGFDVQLNSMRRHEGRPSG